MNQKDAITLINSRKLTVEQVLDVMLNEYDGLPSITIRDFTRRKAHSFFRWALDGKSGLILPETGEAHCAELVLREFHSDL